MKKILALLLLLPSMVWANDDAVLEQEMCEVLSKFSETVYEKRMDDMPLEEVLQIIDRASDAQDQSTKTTKKLFKGLAQNIYELPKAENKAEAEDVKNFIKTITYEACMLPSEE